jgi:hypothetical protein
MPSVFLLVDVWFRVLLMMGSYPPGLQVPDVLGMVAAGHDDRGKVGVVVMRAEARRVLRVWMLTWTKTRAAALIALTGGAGRASPGVI